MTGNEAMSVAPRPDRARERARRARRDRIASFSPVLRGVVGVAGLLIVWTLLSLIVPGRALPSPADIVLTMIDDGPEFYGTNLAATFGRMLPGYLIGNAVALTIAAVVLLVRPLEQLANQLGVIADCLPITAIGPLVMIMFGGATAATFLAALVVFYTSLVTSLIGVHAARRSSLDLVQAYGGGRLTKLRKVQIVAALPAVFTALKLAVPAAFVGALVGEYLGGIDVGIGVALQAAQRDILPARVFGLSLTIGLLSLAGYALIGWLGRILLPWSDSNTTGRRR